MTDRPPSPARRAALIRLLEDWEAGRMTPIAAIRRFESDLHELRAIAYNSGFYTLTPAGAAAARAIREKGE